MTAKQAFGERICFYGTKKEQKRKDMKRSKLIVIVMYTLLFCSERK